MAWKTLDDMDLSGKVVLVRVDINVPVENGVVTDATRIEKIVPTISDILEKGGKPVLLAHFGRPKGKVVPEMSLKPLVPALEAALGRKVTFAEDCIGGPAKKAVAAMQPGDVVLLENTRFHAGEEKNDPELAAGMAALGEIYVNDAFSAAHRAHSSTEGIAHILPSCAGRLMEAAGRALARAAMRRFRPCRTLVLAGPGNNGGDGYVAARLLEQAGWPVAVAALSAPRAGSDAAAAATRWHGPVLPFAPAEAARAGLVIDAVFGAGLARPVDGLVAETLAAAA